MENEFKGKKVLVTGGTRGIGEAIASAFFSKGSDVMITGTTSQSIEEFQKRHPDDKYKFRAVNFEDRHKFSEFLAELKTAGIDILVNNAGINKINTISDLKMEDWERIQRINVQAAVEISQAVAYGMQTRKQGRIINIASVFGVVSKSQRMAYTASKSALIGITKTMALDLAPEGILVNAISPGFIDTELTHKVLGAAGVQEMIQKVPLKKLGTGKDIAEVALFIASSKNQFLTGQNIVVDGGFTCE